MANTVNSLNYANTFADWLVATDALILENNSLGKSSYHKDTGTLYLDEPTSSLETLGSAKVQGELISTGSQGASIDYNLTVKYGQVYFQNTTLGLTNAGQANINGLLIAQGPGLSLSVANNAYVGGNTTIRLNTITNTVQANTSVNTTTASVIAGTYTNTLQANSSVLTTALQSNTSVITGTLQANSSVTTGILQSNTYVNTAMLSVTTTGYVNKLQANSVVNTAIVTADTTYSNTIQANTTLIAPVANVYSKLDANTAVAYVGALQTLGQLSVGGNFVINGSTVYNTNNFTINAGSSTGLISAFEVNRGLSGANASIRWNEPSSYWDLKNVSTSNYSRILTEEYPGSFAQGAYAAANAAAGTFVGTTGSFKSNTVTFSSNNGVTVVSVGSNTFSISTSQDLRSTASPTFANPTFNSIASLTNPLSPTFGGTGTNNLGSGFQALIYGHTGTYGISGQVLTTNGNGTYTWGVGVGSGGGSGALPGTRIDSSRLSYTANGAAGYTGNTFTIPYYTQANQVRVYADGVRQFESEYTLNSVSNTITFATTPTNGQQILIEVDGYVTYAYYANNIAYTVNSNISNSANTIQLAIDGLTSKVTTYYANLASGGTFTGDIKGITMPTGTSNTSFATTAYVQNLANNAGTLHTNIDGNAATVTNGVYTNGSYSNPAWLTGVANTKIIGLIQTSQIAGLSGSAGTDTTNATNITSGTLDAARLATSGVTATGYGTSSSVPTFVVDSKGRITSASNSSISISTSQIYNFPSLASSAYTDTTNAYNISAGVLSSSRLPYAMNQDVANYSNPQFNSLGIGTGASGSGGDLRAYGNITAYYGQSDIRLKENIIPYTTVLDKIDDVNVYNFNYKTRPDLKMVGVIAQEIKEQFPELVYETQPIDAEAGLDTVYAVNYELMSAVLLQAVKELKKEVEALKGQIK